MTEPDALFHRTGPATYTPTALTTGPWRADAMHGGPPSALVATTIADAAPTGAHLARITIELERPVPLAALTTEVTVRPVSRRVTHLDATLTLDDGTVVVTARGLALARSDVPPPATAQPVDEVPGLDEGQRVRMAAFASGELPLTYHRDAVQHRMTADTALAGPGPGTSWVRLEYPLVAGDPVLPIARVMAAADFGSGISAIFDPAEGVGLINADLSVALLREPVGEWIRIDARTRLDTGGTALAATTIHDERGWLGTATQSLLGLRF